MMFVQQQCDLDKCQITLNQIQVDTDNSTPKELHSNTLSLHNGPS